MSPIVRLFSDRDHRGIPPKRRGGSPATPSPKWGRSRVASPGFGAHAVRMHSTNRNTTTYLVGLSALFVGRVVVQFVQLVHEFDWLPPFVAWQSGALPYPALIVFQVGIVVVQIGIIKSVMTGRRILPPNLVPALACCGFVYLGVMVVRLIAGLTFADGDSWLDARLPTLFHLVLAGFLLILVRHESTTTALRPTATADDDHRLDADVGAQ